MDLALRDEQYISQQRRLPVDGVASDAIQSVTGETVQLYYYNAGVLTIDAGQAAGVVVVGKLANRNIKNAIGDVVGTYLDTSLAFTSTALTTLRQFPYKAAEESDTLSGTAKAVAITSGFANGEYCIDHRTGTVYGVKTTTAATLTATSYKVELAVSGGGGGIASDVNLDEINGSPSTTMAQAYGIDVAGADTYTTVVTTTAARHHIHISLQGANDAIISLDGGTTDHYYIPANSVHVFDGLEIPSGAIIQGKNASGGNNYVSLAITAW